MGIIRAGIVGYGNIGRGVEKAIRQNPDFELAAILTRRPPDTLAIDTPTAEKLHVDDALRLKGKVDVMMLCGGSATDLPVQGPEFAANFNTVDSYDTHAKIPEYFDRMNVASQNAGLISLISAGWDPGLFSVIKTLSQSVLPNGSGCAFWGDGVSQGHSDAIRRVEGVEAATQYTIPIKAAVERARNGESAALSTRDKHIRECYIVAKKGADKAKIENSVKSMPYYFDGYDTNVHFIGMDEYKADHTGMRHAGLVIHSGGTDGGRHVIEYSLTLGHNAEFTASVMVAYARAAYRFYCEGKTGALTVLDVPFAYLSPLPAADLRSKML